MILVKYDKPIEVSASKYSLLIKLFSGEIAGRISEGKYFIKVWDMINKQEIERILNSEKL